MIMAKKIFKKLLLSVFVFAMLSPIMEYSGANIKEVQAAEETQTVGYVIVPSSAVTITNPTDEKNPKVMSIDANDATYGQYADYIFAGWYTDEAATKAAPSGTTGKVQSGEKTAYARFVPSDVLSTKVQVTNGIVTNTTNDAYRNKYVMRFVSSVDGTDYQYAGFEVSYEDTNGDVVKKTSKTTKVFKRIDSTTGATANEVDTYEFSPKVLDTKSTYFITSKLPVAVEDIDVDYTVRAYWMTKDGTKVYGSERCVSVEDGAGDTAKTRINLTVDKELSTENGVTYTATYTNRAGATITATDIEVLKVGNGTSIVRINDADKDTKSVTKITVSDGTTSATGIYRNFYSKYEGKIDTTWYDLYHTTDTEFVISSSADLFGLSTLVNTQRVSLEGKTIYVVADIRVNTEKLEVLENENYLKWYTVGQDGKKVYTDRPTYSWTPIGDVNKYFDGTFDAGMHTISGLYLDTTAQYAGLFGVTKTTAKVQNLKVKNSYFKSTANDVGSIAGMGYGQFYNVYSDAVLNCTKARSGGLIGVANGTDTKMTNCWFAGTITNVSAVTGGLVGDVYDNVTLTMEGCTFTGVVDVTACTNETPYAGGLVGQGGHGNSGVININDCFIAGKINAKTTKTVAATVGGLNKNGKVNANGVYYASTASSRSIYLCGAVEDLKGAINKADAYTGSAAQDNMKNLDWDNTWKTVSYGIPVLTVFEKEAFDTSWYNEDKQVFVLEDIGDFYGFAELSKETNFAGKTVKLANDIIVNAGSAEDWAAGSTPDNIWTPIGMAGVGANNYATLNSFAGTFDGGMHTISGIYHNTPVRYSGLFAGTASTATVKNLKIKNSYFKSTFAGYSYFGSVVGSAQGTFDSIYSDAIVNVVGDAAAGMIGGTQGKATINNCMYAGTFTNTGTSRQGHAGIVGYTASNSVVNLSNCLNTGTISSKSTLASPWLAGMIGGCENSTISINSCLNVGLIQSASGTTKDFGSIIGGHMNCKAIEIEQATTVGTEEGSTYNSSAYKITVLAERNLIGNKATSAVAFDWNSTWQAVDYKTPTLQAFSDEIDKRIDVEWYANAAGTAEDPYVLMDANDLYGFSMISKTDNFVDKFVQLGADIVVNEGTPSAEWLKSNYREWEPIGMTGVDGRKYATLNEFAGTFDGDMHTISGLYYVTDVRYGGLFAGTSTTATVKNLKLKNSYFKSTFGGSTLAYGFFGSVVGSAQGNFNTIYADITMDAGTSAVGGIIGGFRGTGSANNCWFDGTVKNTNAAQQIHGGVVGVVYSASADITNCLNTGTISTNSTRANWVAGILGGGDTLSASTPVNITNCLNIGLIQQTANHTAHYGAIVGSYNSKAPTISNSYGTIESCTRGVILNETLKNERAFIGSAAVTSLNGFDFTDTWTSVEYKTPVLTSFADEVDKRIDVDWYTEVDETVGTTAENPYILMDANDLYGFSMISKTDNFADKYVKLGADIVVNEGTPSASWTNSNYRQWEPIGMTGYDGSKYATMNEFAGTFDGDMHTISGVYYVTDIRYGGLFVGTSTTATIQNLKLKNSYFKESFGSYSYFGGLVGSTKGTIQTIYADITVDADSSAVGGIIGGFRASGCIVDNCWFAGTVTNINAGKQIHGGIAGYAYGAGATITNCLNTGTISTNATGANWIGGIIGGPESSTVAIENCLNVGLIQQTANHTANFGPIYGHYAGTAPTLTNCYATSESCTFNPANKAKLYSETELLGNLAEEKLQGFDFTEKWDTVDYKTPVLKSFENETDKRVDVSWYDVEKDVYTLNDAADLYGFAMISTVTNFEGKTIKLGKDIALNSGTPSPNWKKSNYRQWNAIGYTSPTYDSNVHFKGTFDGQGHTISGLYMNTAKRYVGLFAVTASGSVIQNVRLVNSYITSTNRDIGSIVGIGSGDLYRVYSNATVEGANQSIGGMIGQSAGANQKIENCWFAGSVKNAGTTTRDTGGFVGEMYGKKLTMTNCLNSGTVDAQAYANSTVATGDTEESVSPRVGGFGGHLNGTLELNQCVNVGSVLYNAAATRGYGPFVGYGTNINTVSIGASYASAESCPVTDMRTQNKISANYTELAAEDMKDAAAQTNMPNLSWGSNWKTVSEAFPEVICDYKVSGSAINVLANSDDQAKLASLYSGRVLYQGDMHAHAKTLGANAFLGGLFTGDDGNVTLSEWATQLQSLNMDFAASMDHKQINHIDDTANYTWDESKFVYGSEGKVQITDIATDSNAKSGYLHFTMIFKTKADFDSVLTKYASKFNYDPSKGTYDYNQLRFNKADFATFIKDVKAANGFIDIPHPMQAHDGTTGEADAKYYSNVIDDYFFDAKDDNGNQVFYGFQVITSNIAAGNAKTNLAAWKELLAKGYRVYATAGSDTHDNLVDVALTSIYANTCNGEKCTGGCGDADCAGSDKGNLLQQLRTGDFAAGAVGIQMCMYGDNTLTAMGGSSNFSANKRLVIKIGDIHTSTSPAVNSGHKFRVDVINENGVVYSKFVTAGEQIALDVKAYGFYRVEVYDVNHATSAGYPTGLLIGLSNPIWNDEYTW